jgi:hypothetical protein
MKFMTDRLYRNYYRCGCGHSWDDDWDAKSPDLCTKCGATVLPYDSINAYAADYEDLLQELAGRGIRTRAQICRALGLAPNALTYRRRHPETVKLEHVLAVEGLLARVRA